MIQKILQTLLISTALFSYEIRLDTPSQIEKKAPKSEVKLALVRDETKEIVVDKNTGLMWQDNIDAKTLKKNRKDAKQYCRNLVLAGYHDWYLPPLKQLKSIVDAKKYNPAIREGFKNVQAYHYWSASPNLSWSNINVSNIDFKNGQVYNNNRNGMCNVRCVRGKYTL